MGLILMPNNEVEDGCSPDSKKYQKDCCHFTCLEDGTLTKEYHYCNFSLLCRQIDVLVDGKVVPMESHFLPVYDINGELKSHELFCTGMHDNRPLKERIEDDKVF
jgi:hypothetical protein